MKETIAEMLKAEDEAKRTVSEAESRAEELVRNARAEAAALELAAQQKAQGEAAKLVEDGVQQARERRVELLRQIDRDNEQLRAVAPDKSEAAKKLILAALIGQ